MTTITLTLPEAYSACVTGVMRNLRSLMRNTETRIGDATWQIHCEGACGEMAVAKALNIHNPLTIDNFTGADLGTSIQVRTRSKHYYDLLVREGDGDDQAFVLVTGGCPEYRVHGWMWGRDAKRGEWLKEYGGHPPAYFVPQSELRPLSELPEEAL